MPLPCLAHRLYNLHCNILASNSNHSRGTRFIGNQNLITLDDKLINNDKNEIGLQQKAIIFNLSLFAVFFHRNDIEQRRTLMDFLSTALRNGIKLKQS